LYISSFLLGRTVWDVFKVLAVPITVGAAVPLLNWLQKKRELDVADQRAQDDALQAYLDQMAQLMLLEEADEAKPKPLRKSVRGDDVRILARARTLTVLRRLRSGRKRSVLDFLYEAGLIEKTQPIIELGSPDRDGNAADLRGAELIGAVLRRADLSGMHNGANLSGADLRGADLFEANLSRANLRGSNLSGADLSYVDLSGADVSERQLRDAKSLEAAIMPYGSKHDLEAAPIGE
jgi:hypothetical protein